MRQLGRRTSNGRSPKAMACCTASMTAAKLGISAASDPSASRHPSGRATERQGPWAHRLGEVPKVSGQEVLVRGHRCVLDVHRLARRGIAQQNDGLGPEALDDGTTRTRTPTTTTCGARNSPIATFTDASSRSPGTKSQVRVLSFATRSGMRGGRSRRPPFASANALCRSMRPEVRWREGIARRHRSNIFPEDCLELFLGAPADILVTHKAPAAHRYGWQAIDELAEALGV